MFKKKSTCSLTPKIVSRYLLLSTGFVVSLTAGSSYAQPPMKNSEESGAGSIMRGAAPGLPRDPANLAQMPRPGGPVPVLPTPTETPDQQPVEGEAALDFASLRLEIHRGDYDSDSSSSDELNISDIDSSDSDYDQNPLNPDENHEPDENHDSDENHDPDENYDSDENHDPDELYKSMFEIMQEKYKKIQKNIHLPSDANATSGVFPESIPVTELIRNTDVNQALESIVNTPDDHTLVDVYFLLFKLAEQAGQSELMTASRDIAALIQYYSIRSRIGFNSLANIQAGRESLLTSLRSLLDTLRHNAADNNGVISESTLRLLFDNIYSNVIAIAEAEFMPPRENAVNSSEAARFLSHISVITSYGRGGYLGAKHSGLCQQQGLVFFKEFPARQFRTLCNRTSTVCLILFSRCALSGISWRKRSGIKQTKRTDQH